MASSRLTLILALTVIGASSGATAQEKVGKVSFPISCSPAVQEEFDRAVALAPLLLARRRRSRRSARSPRRTRAAPWPTGAWP